jgi:aminoglycoside phosphotransferase (APT) family kinase protein
VTMQLRTPTWDRDRSAGVSVASPGRGSDRVARACVLVPQILASHSDSLPPRARHADVVSAELTSTGVVVVVLAAAGEPPCLVIKMPTTPEAVRGLERETAVLAALHADGRLGRWRDLLPRPCAHGGSRERPYRIDAALAGQPIQSPAIRVARGTLLEAAARAIDVLHRVTATTVGAVDVAEAWVDVPLRELTARARRRPELLLQFERLRDELHEGLSGRTLSAGWVHGDYWPGNVLFASKVSTSAVPTGIVDWDASGRLELPLHDLLHLVLYTRRLLTRRELGQIVRDLILDCKWSVAERVVLDRYGSWRHDGSLSERHALLLYWLRQAAMHARQQSLCVGYRYRLWQQRNVLPVLAVR